MNQRNSTRATCTLFFCAIVFFAGNVHAQESSVDRGDPPRITQSLISRGELNRLISQPPRNGNPLRRPQTQAGIPIRDPSVKPASWQQQEEPKVSTEGFVVNKLEPKSTPPKPDTTTQPDKKPDEPKSHEPIEFGPHIGPDMEHHFHELDKLSNLSIEELGQEIIEHGAEIDASLGIDNEAKNNRLIELEIAEEAYKQARQYSAAKAEYQTKITQLDGILERLRTDSKKPIEPLPIDANLSIEAMQMSLRNQQAELEHEKSNVGKILEQIQQRDERMAKIPGERLQKREKANQIHEELLQKQAAGTEEFISLLALRARELAATTHIESLEQERTWHDLSQEKLPLEKAIHQRRIERMELEIKDWNTTIANSRQAELERQIQLARRKAFEAHPSLKEFSEETTELAKARAEFAMKISKLQEEKLKVDKQDSEVKRQHTELENSINDVGKDDSRDLLIEVHRNLIRPYEGMARVQNLENERRITRGKLLKLRNELDQFNDPQKYIRDILKIENDKAVANTTLVTLAQEAVETHRLQLSAFIKDNERYGNSLESILLVRENLVDEITATRKLVDTYALWVQSADPVSIELLQKSSDGAGEFFDFKQWKDLGNSIVSRVSHRPYESGVGMFGLLIAFVVGRRFKG